MGNRALMPGNETCPVCGQEVADSQYPRYRVILEDESDSAPNQRAENRLCSECWSELQTEMSALAR